MNILRANNIEDSKYGFKISTDTTIFLNFLCIKKQRHVLPTSVKNWQHFLPILKTSMINIWFASDNFQWGSFTH